MALAATGSARRRSSPLPAPAYRSRRVGQARRLGDETLYASIEPGKMAALDPDDLSVRWVFPPDTDEGNSLKLEGRLRRTDRLRRSGLLRCLRRQRVRARRWDRDATMEVRDRRGDHRIVSHRGGHAVRRLDRRPFVCDRYDGVHQRLPGGRSSKLRRGGRDLGRASYRRGRALRRHDGRLVARAGTANLAPVSGFAFKTRRD